MLEICEIGEQGVLVAGPFHANRSLSFTGKALMLIWAAINSSTNLMNSRLRTVASFVPLFVVVMLCIRANG